VHYSLWFAEVGCAKVACAYNYKYDWLRPKLEEIVAA
jgi:hypothetical protein